MTKYNLAEFKRWLKEKKWKDLVDIGARSFSEYNFESYVEYPGATTYSPFLKEYKVFIDEEQQKNQY